jgi:hypothetical protein
MADSEKSSTPAAQRTEAGAADSAAEPTKATLEQARQFLNHDTVKAAGPEEKRAFLRTKGFDDAQITQLLDEIYEEGQVSTGPQPTTSSSHIPEVGGEATTDTSETKEFSAASSSSTSTSTESSSPASQFAANTPPIVTYPEFLTKPQRPPPLITPSRLANIFAVSGTIWALLYGTAGLVVRPMVDNLNEARSDYYAHVKEKLGELVGKLEVSVSEVPYKDGKPPKSQHQSQETLEDNDSVTSDPTELFHRDVGTQTSPPPSVSGVTANNKPEKPVDAQARKLAAMSASLRELTLMHTQNAERMADCRSSVGELRDQIDKLAYPPIVQDFSTYGGLGYGRSAEPDDEFKKTKDAIRSVKGIFLSTRSFPAVTMK